jgi:uncharacterized protein (TIGR00106 family)
MHSHIINASIQVVPVSQDKHPYIWIDETIEIIRDSGTRYEIGPFATVLEGTYDEVMKTVHAVNNYLQSRGCTEWICNIQVQARHDRDITAIEKIAKYRPVD